MFIVIGLELMAKKKKFAKGEFHLHDDTIEASTFTVIICITDNEFNWSIYHT